MRFRLPDHLAGHLHHEMGRVEGQSNLPPAAGRRMGFYFVPGTRERVFLYPAQNIDIAISRFESPPPGVDPAQVRKARDYFYSMMTFVEADKQNRLQIPQHLCEHAGLDEGASQIVLVGHNLWLSLSRAAAAEEIEADGREALEAIGPDILDPVTPQQPPGPAGPAQGQ
jgi:DNA-binding transcriptional regulator/RsmH inhibitor MraZ